MPIDFPNTPSIDDLFVDPNGRTWIYTASGWRCEIVQAASIAFSTSPPDYSKYPFWFNTLTGKLYVYYVDVDSGQWVSVGDRPATAINLDDLLDVDTTTNTPSSGELLEWNGVNLWVPSSGGNVHYGAIAPTNPVRYPIWFNTDTGDVAIYYNDGTSSQWIGINTTWNVTQQTTPAFMARMSASQGGRSSATYYVVPFDNDSSSGGFDENGDFNTSTNCFVAPYDGIYHFSTSVRYDGSTADYMRLVMFVNGINFNPIIGALSDFQQGSYDSLGFSTTLKLNASDYVDIRIYSSNDTSWTIHNESYFSGHLVKRLA